MLIGLVGKPSVGKSTFFKAATLAEVAIAAYPFTTLEPNEGAAFVKVECVDKEFSKQCKPRFGYCIDGKRFVPVRLMDVPGLVPGAHAGKGMGNEFLDSLREADALIHVIDVSGSTNEKGEAVPAGSYDPAEDVRFLEEELDLWYYAVLQRGWEKLARHLVMGKEKVSEALAKQMSAFKVTEELVEDIVWRMKLKEKKPTDWTTDEVKLLAQELRRRTKPMIIACNKIDVPGAAENFIRLKKDFPHELLVACSAESELALREAARKNLISYVPGEKDFTVIDEKKLNDAQKKALQYIRENILEIFFSTGVQQVLDVTVFGLLRYIAIFPGGANKLEDKEGRALPDCFLLPDGSTALDFAYKLHTDLGNSFIRAIDVKTKRTVGKEYQLKHRDVVEIISGK